jgi:hypothetical protein
MTDRTEGDQAGVDARHQDPADDRLDPRARRPDASRTDPPANRSDAQDPANATDEPLPDAETTEPG